MPEIWRYEASGRKGRAWLIVASDHPDKPGWSPASVTKEEHARLIAAAPDLLEALTKISGLLAPGESDPDLMAELLRQVSDITDAAIAKAPTP